MNTRGTQIPQLAAQYHARPVMSFPTSAVGTGQPKVVYGKVIGLDGHPKTDELIILTATKSQTLLAQTDHQGY
ncbi:hypothetical protein CMK13_19000 [Candidatus Poribacteria bacterium]|nr:hypothetical protein [Candidatus Poribacteria bacterium]OUT54136.1 MAG: hypothetical protein CBB75_18250 [bacterium TMED15]